MSEAINTPPPSTPFRLKDWYPEISEANIETLKTFFDELMKVNKVLNLISQKTVPIADALHFADSYCASKVIMTANPNIDVIYDFGSGNGFPGIVFAVFYPKVQVKLVDVDAKRCEFLKVIVLKLGLSNVSVTCGAVDSLPEGSVKFAMTRGISNISKAILMCRKQVVKGGIFFHLKSEEWGMEVAEIPTQLCSIWSPGLVGEYKLPVGGPKFSVVKTDKIS